MNLDFPHQVPQAHPTTSLHLTSNFSFLKSHQVQGQTMELQGPWIPGCSLAMGKAPLRVPKPPSHECRPTVP